MPSLNASSVRTTLEIARALGPLGAPELAEVMGAFDPDYPLADALQLSDTMHVHVKVDATDTLPHAALHAAGGHVENEKDGYVKYAFASGMNLIFSSIAVSQDDLREAASKRRARPFLDHYGLDLRRELPEVRAAFDACPRHAADLGWAHVPQGGEGNAVFCCHVSVAAKHWLFPRAPAGTRRASVEVAYGALTVMPDKSGCDLRPADPRSGLAVVAGCCAGGAATEGDSPGCG